MLSFLIFRLFCYFSFVNTVTFNYIFVEKPLLAAFEGSDPLQAYIDKPINQDKVALTKDSRAESIAKALLWRLPKEESFSDWTIVLVADELDQSDDENQDSPERCTKRQKTDDQTLFHVHRCTLATFSSYFKTQFSTQVDTVERRTSTSTIRLHPCAIEVFPVFLNYMYSPEQARKDFTRENVVVLRHLAMYFGADMLLEDITNMIVADMKNKYFREVYKSYSSALIDLKLLEAIKVTELQQDSLKAVVPALFQTLIGDPAKYLQDENELLFAWKHVMSSVDLLQNTFYVEKNTTRFRNLSVTDAGLRHVNGEYRLLGRWHSAGLYTNGVCLLVKSSSGFWSFDISYFDYNVEQDRFLRSHKMLYSSSCTSDHPPSGGWRVVYTNMKSKISKDPGPTITVMF